MKNELEFKDFLELFVGELLNDIAEANKEPFTRTCKESDKTKTENDAQTAFKKMNKSAFRSTIGDIRRSSATHHEYEKVYPVIVKEALISYKKTLENERETSISSCTNELERVSAWIKEKIEEDRRYYYGDNPVYDPSNVLDKVIDGMKKDAISKSTYYTDKINQITCILEGYTFEDTE